MSDLSAAVHTNVHPPLCDFLVGTWKRNLRWKQFGANYQNVRSTNTIVVVEEYKRGERESDGGNSNGRAVPNSHTGGGQESGNTRYLRWKFGKDLSEEEMRFGYSMKLMQEHSPPTSSSSSSSSSATVDASASDNDSSTHGQLDERSNTNNPSSSSSSAAADGRGDDGDRNGDSGDVVTAIVFASRKYTAVMIAIFSFNDHFITRPIHPSIYSSISQVFLCGKFAKNSRALQYHLKNTHNLPWDVAAALVQVIGSQ
jgi:hypothetical protein